MPKLIETVLGTLLSFLSAKTQESVKVYGYDKEEWAAALREECPYDQLPIQYGGGRNSTTQDRNKTKSNSWEWNNLAIEKLIHDFKENQTSSCTFHNLLVNIPDLEPEPNPIHEDSTMTHHPHRHHHGHHHRNRIESDSMTKSHSFSKAENENYTFSTHFESEFWENHLEDNNTQSSISHSFQYQSWNNYILLTFSFLFSLNFIVT